jgi:DNA-binding transcriptional LysR family regulator
MPFNLDNALLKSFIAISETRNFTEAANIVGRSQSALSLQIKNLEAALGCKLFLRSSRRVLLTKEGEVFLGYAQRIMDLQWEAYSKLREPDIEGEIRLATPEDFATHYLPKVLSTFRQHHPRIQLRVECDLTLNLLSGFKQGKYDIALVKRDPAKVKGGIRVWKEPLVWVCADNYAVQKTISLVLSPEPCIYRSRAIAGLNKIKRPWSVSYSSPSLAGSIAAVKAGIGVTVLPSNMVPEGLHVLRNLPHLPDSEIALMKNRQLSKAGEILVDHIIQSLKAY